MILNCSRGHIWDTDDIQTRLKHSNLKLGDRCPMEMSYDRMTGSTYCHRILKAAKEVKSRIFRKVIGYESYRYYKAHGDSIILKLECGHEVGRKASECSPSIPKKVICRQCEFGGNS